MIGASIGGYRISEKLAEGGMGEVYIARHDLMERDAVVKVLLPELSVNQELVKRFFNEARAAASIHHPGIVEVYDMGFSADGRAYIIMERLRGESLAARLRRGRPGTAETCALVRHLAGAVGAAHERGIVHRDLKPDNVFVVPDPDVPGGQRTKVLDFGVAKLAARRSGSLATRAGSIFGTPAYMAPEQCSDSAAVDHRADLYALGCILYELLCGQPPFGQGGIELLAAHLRDPPPPPRSLAPGLSPLLEAITLRLLEKRPDARFASCAELADALRVTETDLGAVAGPAVASVAFAPTMAPAPAPAVAAVPTPHALTTHQLSSGQAVAAAPVAATSGRGARFAIIGGAVALVGGVIALVLVTGGGSGDEVATDEPPAEPPAASPPPVVQREAPEPPPSPGTGPVDSPDPAAARAAAVEAAAETTKVVKRKHESPTRKEPPPEPRPVVKPAPAPRPGPCDEVSCMINPTQRCCPGYEKPLPKPPPPGEPSPEWAPGEPADPQPLTKTDIMAGIAAIKGKALACHEQYGVSGTVGIRLTISPDGGVTSASAGGSFAGTPTGDCVAAAVKQATFRASPSGITVTFPFALR